MSKVSEKNSRWAKTVPFLLGLEATGFLAILAIGLLWSLANYGRLPLVQIDYFNDVRLARVEDDPLAAMKTWRTSNWIDYDSEQAAYNLLQIALKTGDNDVALAALIELVRFKPTDSHLRNALVSAYLRQGRAAEAFAHAEVAVQLAPTWAAAYSNLGSALLGLERKQEAAAVYRKALDLDPSLEIAKQALQVPLRGY